ncbi:hypothetical protein [Clostridium sp. LIBA-8841]|uniref:hypothetical protein n=1 Tax=Clostridium sp. LIBA-8841 TaxID=2987530 RepID=UPI002AC5541D|nr:hypothetical protein [Clostridium sp. LIBA-8841]MDZ5254391.1 hypothetical protein [Clostridium sp. LIBA-8841]
MKKWENPELMILGVENTKEEDLIPLAPPDQNCDCINYGNGNPGAGNGNSGHTHGTQPQFCPCCANNPSLS